MRKISGIIGLLLALLTVSGCYTFKGISIDPNVSTYDVRIFETGAPNAPSTLGIEFTEKLKDKIRREARLGLNSNEPDIEITGTVSGFRVVPVSPKPGETIASNRLEIDMLVGLANNKVEKDGWVNDRKFSFFIEFDTNQDFLAIQDKLIEEISNQLLEDIFNAAFNNW